MIVDEGAEFTLKLDGKTEPARAVTSVMMARAKKNYILIIKVKNLIPLFSYRCFLKEIENIIEKARVPIAFLVLPNFH